MKPQMDIKFLSDEEFDNMPILDRLGEDVSNSLGIYNPYTGQVRIRDTKIWEVNKYLLEHELEHGVEEHATDEGPNGLRHKKFFKEFVPRFFFPPLEVISPTTEVGSGLNQGVGGSGGKPAKRAQEKQAAQQKALSESGFYSSPFGGFGSSLQGSSSSQGGVPQNSQGSLNSGLNSQTVNPLDPYARFGQQAGRISF